MQQVAGKTENFPLFTAAFPAESGGVAVAVFWHHDVSGTAGNPAPRAESRSGALAVASCVSSYSSVSCLLLLEKENTGK